MAADRQPETMPMLVTRDDQPLVGVVCAHDDALVRYFPDEMAAEGAEPEPIAQAALGAVGSWSDLDWDDVAAALDRIRHESSPIPLSH